MHTSTLYTHAQSGDGGETGTGIHMMFCTLQVYSWLVNHECIRSYSHAHAHTQTTIFMLTPDAHGWTLVLYTCLDGGRCHTQNACSSDALIIGVVPIYLHAHAQTHTHTLQLVMFTCGNNRGKACNPQTPAHTHTHLCSHIVSYCWTLVWCMFEWR